MATSFLEIGGIGLQIVRDWVLPRRQALRQVVEDSPIPAIYSVVR